MSSKTTEIHVRAFNTDFVIELEKDYFISIEQAIAWALIEMIDTAIVIKVVQKWTEGDLEMFNDKVPSLMSKENRDKHFYKGVVKPLNYDQIEELYNKPKIKNQTYA